MRFSFIFLVIALARPCVSQTKLTVPCSNAAEINLPAGTFLIAPTDCPIPVHIRGAGIRQTILRPIGDVAFRLTGGSGYTVSDLSFDMRANSRATVFLISGPYRPIFENIEAFYSVNGTGKVFDIAGSAEPRIRNIIVQNAGFCLIANGDHGLEFFIDTFTCENPGVVGIKIWRTTRQDIGAIWFNRVKVTNPSHRIGAQGIVIGSSTANTLMPIFFTDVTADGLIGADSFILQNVNLFRASDSWFTNSSPSGSNCTSPLGQKCFAAMVLNNAKEIFMTMPYFQSASRDVALIGNVTTMRMLFPKLASPNVNIYMDSLRDKNNLQLYGPVPNGMLTNAPSVLKVVQ